MGSMSIYTVIALAFVIGVFYVFFRALAGLLGAGRKTVLVCTVCGHCGPTARKTKGSLAIEIVLWLCFLVPGILYSLWRITTRAPMCVGCGSQVLVGTDSPVGRKILAEQQRGA